MSTTITLPLMGEGVIEATIGTWLKAVGDTVKQFEPLVEVETDKVTTEVVADEDGVLLQIMVAEGDVVAVEQVLAVIGVEGEQVSQSATTGMVNATAVINGHAAPPVEVAVSPTIPQPRTYSGKISPVVARMVKTHVLDLNQIIGTGKAGRITKRDIELYLVHPTTQPLTDPITQQTNKPTIQYPVIPQPSNPVTSALRPHTPMRRRIAEHMVMSKATSPHATTVHEIDYTAVKAHRKKHKVAFAARGIKLTYMAYLAVAVVRALQVEPWANSSWQEDGMLLHNTIHLGIAAAVADGGLVVPVIKNAGGLNLQGMAQAIGAVAKKARAKQLTADDMHGGTFTITNHGVFGSLFATPIINQPQAGILGIGVVEDRVCAVDGMIAIRPKAYASFSFDHRILDGASADHFMQVVRETIEKWE